MSNQLKQNEKEEKSENEGREKEGVIEKMPTIFSSLTCKPWLATNNVSSFSHTCRIIPCYIYIYITTTKKTSRENPLNNEIFFSNNTTL